MSEFPEKSLEKEQPAEFTGNVTHSESAESNLSESAGASSKPADANGVNSGINDADSGVTDKNVAESTIFVKHVYNTKQPAKKGGLKRIMTCVIAVILCAAIGGSVLLVNKFLPKDDDSSSNVSALEDLNMLILKPDDFIKPSYVNIGGESVEVDTNISSVSVYNYYENYSFSPYFEPAASAADSDTDATSSSDSKASDTSSKEEKTYLYDTLWRINGIDEKLTVSKTISDKITDCMTLYASQEMENTFSTVEEYYTYYGMDDPTREFTVEFNDGTDDLVITVGTQLATGDANYVRLSSSDKVYAVKASYIANYDYLPIHFGNTDVIDAIEKDDSNSGYFNDTGDLARYDYIKLSGGLFENDSFEFVMSNGVSADYMPYMMNVPYHRPADNDFISSLLAFADNGLSASSLYSFNATEENSEICGLNDPKCVIELKIGDYGFKLIIGGMLTEGSDTLAVKLEGKPQIFSIAASEFDFLNAASVDRTKMLNANFIMEDIYTIDHVTFTDSTGSHKFELKHTEQADNEGVYDTAVTYRGSVMDTSSFKSLYQRVLLLSLLEYTLEAEKTETLLNIEFTYIDGGGSKVVEFTESQDDIYHYLAWVDGTVMGEVLKSSVTDIITNLDSYVQGGTVSSIW